MDGACWGGVGAPGPRTKTSRSSHGQLPLPALAALAGALSPDGIQHWLLREGDAIAIHISRPISALKKAALSS